MSISNFALWFLWAAPLYVLIALIVIIATTAKSGRENPDISEIEIWLWSLLRNGFDGETVLFRQERTGRFVRFEKYVDAGGVAGIALTFPEIRWGREYLPRLRAYCEDHGLSFQGSTDEGLGEKGYARVKFGRDVKGAFALSKKLWTEFYCYGEHDGYLRQVGDFSTVGELTDFPQRTMNRPELMERFFRYLNARLKHTGMPWLRVNSGYGLFGFAALTLGAAVAVLAAIVGLPISTPLSLSESPGWQMEFGSIRAEGSRVSLAFFFMYLLSFKVLRQCLRIGLFHPQGTTRIEKIVLAPKRLVFVAIPIAVVIIWLGI